MCLSAAKASRSFADTPEGENEDSCPAPSRSCLSLSLTSVCSLDMLTHVEGSYTAKQGRESEQERTRKRVRRVRKEDNDTAKRVQQDTHGSVLLSATTGVSSPRRKVRTPPACRRRCCPTHTRSKQLPGGGTRSLLSLREGLGRAHASHREYRVSSLSLSLSLARSLSRPSQELKT